MNFLEAHRVATGATGGDPLPFVLAMSGTPDKLGVFLKAAAARQGRLAEARTLPFDTLSQWLYGEPDGGVPEVVVLFPWDFLPALDWRSGFPASVPAEEDLHARAEAFAARLSARRNARLLYVPAPVPPLFTTPSANEGLRALLVHLACRAGAELLSPEVFSLGSYLSSGSPFAGGRLYEVAETIVRRAATAGAATRKVLVTDLDHVMWHGVIGEDGIEGIRCAGEGAGFKHFLYQGMLGGLERAGVLLAAVSRNDQDLALAPFRTGRVALSEQQFVCVMASYSAKSSQIREIARRLSLGLDSFVFVDDNPVELAEVSSSIPEVACLQFPTRDEGLPELFSKLTELFARSVVTSEDRERTEMYRRRVAGIAPSDLAGADLTSFLRGLEMQLVIHDRSESGRERAVQLVNKTNQFNLNGRRVADDAVESVLRSGGRLLTASLSDQNGSHGEILACLLGPDGTIESLVMSCRVLQRRVEHAFLAWLCASDTPPRALAFESTPRNEPIRQFLRDPAFQEEEAGGALRVDTARFLAEHEVDVSLFRLQAPEPSTASSGRLLHPLAR